MATARFVGIFLFGLVIGIVAGAVGIIVFLRSDVGAGVIAQYVATQPQWPDATPQATASATTTQAIQEFIGGQANIPVPKSYATAQYTVALNATMRDVATIAASSTELSTLLITINNQSLAHNYTGFFDLIVDAKNRVAVQQARVAKLGQDITALTIANQGTMDSQTKALTLELLAKVTPLQTRLQTYTQALNTLLSGQVPSAAQIQSLKDEATALQQQATDFADAAKSLEQYLFKAQQQ